MRAVRGRKAWRWTFPLVAALQLGSVLVIFIYLLVFGGPTQNKMQLDFEREVLPLTPLVWLGLSTLGLVTVLAWRTGRARIAAQIGTWLSGVFGLVGGALLALELVVISSYGADFDFPSSPPMPAFATSVAHADGSDDDDPMRGREVVIDVGAHTEADVVAFYRERFPESEGWSEGSPEVDGRDDFKLCLVNTAERGYDEYVEVYRQGADRFLVSISRLQVSAEGRPRTTDRCGLAGIWFPTNL